MRLKSFHGSTMAEAMAAVRAALGDEAIIIATRDADGGGVQVTAAVDDAPKTEPADAPVYSAESFAEHDVMDIIADALQRHGTSATLAETILAHAARGATGNAAATLAGGLERTLPFAALPDMESKTILLIGPPGAGKTAMIGKLCARAALAGRTCTAISTDLERAGGVAQLATYTQHLKVPLMEVEDSAALRDAMDMHADRDIVFVDSTGINPFDPSAAAQTATLVKQAKATTILVLPAGMEAMDATEIAMAFKALGATHLLPTRLDITRRLGSLLAVAAESRLALCAASASPTLGGGLDMLTAGSLASWLLGEKITAAVTTPAQKTATHGKR